MDWYTDDLRNKLLAVIDDFDTAWDDREDYCQVALLKIAEQADMFDPDKGVQFDTWAVTVGRNAIVDHIRYEDVRSTVYVDLPVDYDDMSEEALEGLAASIDAGFHEPATMYAPLPIVENLASAHGSFGMDPMDELKVAEEVALFYAKLARVPPRLRTVIYKRLVDGDSYARIADATGINESTCRTVIERFKGGMYG